MLQEAQPHDVGHDVRHANDENEPDAASPDDAHATGQHDDDATDANGIRRSDDGHDV